MWAQYNHNSPENAEGVRGDVMMEATLECAVKKTQPLIAGFEDRRKPRAKQGGQLLQVGKGNEMNSPLEPPEENAALLTAWIFVP